MCDSRSTSAPGYLLFHQVPPMPAESSKIVKSEIPCRFKATAAAMPLKPDPMMATLAALAAEPTGRGEGSMGAVPYPGREGLLRGVLGGGARPAGSVEGH